MTNGAAPYRAMVEGYARLLAEGAAIAPADSAPAARVDEARATRGDARPAVLLLSPHPDDECVTGALALRLAREAGARVVNVPVTLGSNRARRRERWAEVGAACAALGFALRAVAPDLPDGVDGLSPTLANDDAAAWRTAAGRIAALIRDVAPTVVVTPHDDDDHPTHVATRMLLGAALERLPDLDALVVETEFWRPMRAPNLMVASSVADVADLVAALALHRGEVARNPYHLRLPAGMMDAVRRGGELLRGHGAGAPAFAFATLYRVSRLRAGALEPAWPGGRIAGETDDVGRMLLGG